jgi:hypothetical protein
MEAWSRKDWTITQPQSPPSHDALRVQQPPRGDGRTRHPCDVISLSSSACPSSRLRAHLNTTCLFHPILSLSLRMFVALPCRTAAFPRAGRRQAGLSGSRVCCLGESVRLGVREPRLVGTESAGLVRSASCPPLNIHLIAGSQPAVKGPKPKRLALHGTGGPLQIVHKHRYRPSQSWRKD